MTTDWTGLLRLGRQVMTPFLSFELFHFLFRGIEMGSGGEARDIFCIICTAAPDYSKQWEINTAIDLRIQASIAH